MRQFVAFLSYHNAVPIAISLVLLGAGATFAATDPGAIYSADQRVISVDNTYIANKDLSGYSPRVVISGVTEDVDNYYVAYDFYTIDLKNAVWQDVVKRQTLTVSKADLGPYRDLGLYVTEQLKQLTDHELAYLKEVQNIERKSVTQKVVATTYGGLVGKFLDASTETLPGYTPIVTPPAPSDTQVASAAGAGEASGGTSSSLKIGLQLLGNNPARVSLNASYVDLGAVLIDPYHTNVGIHAFQNGTEVVSPSIDTSTSSAQTIEYRATDPGGTTIVVRRVVIVGDAADPGTAISSAGNVSVTLPTIATESNTPSSNGASNETSAPNTATPAVEIGSAATSSAPAEIETPGNATSTSVSTTTSAAAEVTTPATTTDTTAESAPTTTAATTTSQ